MPSSSVLPAAVATALAAGAAAAYLYTSRSSKGTSMSIPEHWSNIEVWKNGPWAVGEKDVKGPVRVSELWIHPVKSCKATLVTSLTYSPLGVTHDRNFAIIDAKTHKVLTQRELPQMCHIYPELVPESDLVDGGVLRISFPPDSECEAFEVALSPDENMLADWELLEDVCLFRWSTIDAHVVPAIEPHPNASRAELSRYLGREVILVRRGPNLRNRLADPTALYPALDAPLTFQDDYPLHMLCKESVLETKRLIDQEGGENDKSVWKVKDLDWRRFRANVVMEGGGAPFIEDAWDDIAFLQDGNETDHSHKVQGEGDASITCVSRMARCGITNVDQDTAELESTVLKTLLRRRNFVALEANTKTKGCLGINCVPTGTGTVRVGDVVRVNKWLKL